MKDLLVEIPWKELPKSFQDAISIARCLQFKYLWIDSICIIQNDPLNWKTVSLKMAEICSEAYLTIAVTGASSSTSGCLFTRWHETNFGVKISHDVGRSHSDLISASHGIKTRYSFKAHKQMMGDLYPPVGVHHSGGERGPFKSDCCPIGFSIFMERRCCGSAGKTGNVNVDIWPGASK
jgi:hypothetical protein